MCYQNSFIAEVCQYVCVSTIVHVKAFAYIFNSEFSSHVARSIVMDFSVLCDYCGSALSCRIFS